MEEKRIAWLLERFPSFFLGPQGHVHVGHANTADWAVRFSRVQDIVAQLHRSGEAFGCSHIVVGGTSGKGSTATFIARSLGLTCAPVGLFVSPHLVSLRERFSVFGGRVSESDAVFWETLFEIAQEVWRRFGAVSLSYYEALFLMAGLYFHRCGCRLVVWEVGCGGRWDAVSAVPEKHVSVVTNIGWDHAEILGPTLADIAYQKAGIFLRSRAVAYGETQAELVDILEQERIRAGASLLPQASYGEVTSLGDQKELVVCNGGEKRATLLYGEGHRRNVALAARVCATMQVPKSVFLAQLETGVVPGRIEVICRRPTVVLDIAHNIPKMQNLWDTVGGWPAAKRYAVFACAAHKDGHALFRMVLDHCDQVWVCEFAAQQGRSAISVGTLMDFARAFGQEFRVIPMRSVGQAVADANSMLKSEDMLVITGSTFLYHEAYVSVSHRPPSRCPS